MTQWDVPGVLRRIRRTADLSQRELAQRLGISKSGVAAVESGTADLDVGRLAAAAELAGLRLVLLDGDGREVTGMAADAVRDGARRRFPAHLDTRLSDESRLDGHRYDRPIPTYTAVRDKRVRDAARAERGTPDDHLVPRPGDSPQERRRARQDAAAQQRRAEWQRQRDAGELPPLPDWVCDCPPECPEDEAGTKASHADECGCRCDLG